MGTNNNKTSEKLSRLLDVLRPARSLLIVMQDNPDPDSIASAAALRRLARSSGEISCSIAFGGRLLAFGQPAKVAERVEASTGAT